LTGVVGVGHDGDSTDFRRLPAEILPIVIADVAFFLLPGAGRRGAAFDGDHYCIFDKRIGKCASLRQPVGPDVIDRPGLPEQGRREDNIDPGRIVVSFLFAGISTGDGAFYFPLPGQQRVFFGAEFYFVNKGRSRSGAGGFKAMDAVFNGRCDSAGSSATRRASRWL